MKSNDLSAELAKRIRAAGGRMTVARRVLFDELLEAGGHITADELVERVQQARPGVDRSTIYRNLAALEDSGIVYHVHLAHGPSVYHLTDTGERHAHIVCQDCGAVAELPADTLRALAAELLDAQGFVLCHQHFALTGRCRQCARRSSNRLRTTSVGAEGPEPPTGAA
jgi:Fur family ferric uptake transcriptional regulator